MAKFLDSVGLSHLIAWMKTSLPYLKAADLSTYATQSWVTSNYQAKGNYATSAQMTAANSAISANATAISANATAISTNATAISDLSSALSDFQTSVASTYMPKFTSGTAAAKAVANTVTSNGTNLPTQSAVYTHVSTAISTAISGLSLGTAAKKDYTDTLTATAATLPTCSAIAGYISSYSIKASQLPTISTGDVSGFTSAVNGLISTSITALSLGTAAKANVATAALVSNGTSLPTEAQVYTYVTSAIGSAIAGVNSFEYSVVANTAAVTASNIIYLVAHNHGTGDAYDEYMLINGKVEKIGNTDVDLTGYATESWVTNKGYATTTQAQGYANAALSSAKSYTDSAVSGLASEGYVTSAIAALNIGNYATTTAMNTAVSAALSSAKSYTDSKVSGLATEAYVTSAIADFATESYVTSALSGYIPLPASSVGSATKGIYWNGTSFAANTYYVSANVPSNAKFTDNNTTYTFSAKINGTGDAQTHQVTVKASTDTSETVLIECLSNNDIDAIIAGTYSGD